MHKTREWEDFMLVKTLMLFMCGIKKTDVSAFCNLCEHCDMWNFEMKKDGRKHLRNAPDKQAARGPGPNQPSEESANIEITKCGNVW
jgi:hypothetical protein